MLLIAIIPNMNSNIFGNFKTIFISLPPVLFLYNGNIVTFNVYFFIVIMTAQEFSPFPLPVKLFFYIIT